MRRLCIPALAVMTLGLAACSTATPYQPAPPGPVAGAYGYGYRDAKIDDTHWRVSFSGNSLTSRETVEKDLLYRAAQLTVQEGFDWFEATDKHTDRNTSFYGVGDPFYGAYGWGWAPYWRIGGPWGWRGWGGWGFGGDLDIEQANRFEASAEVVMGHNPQPQGSRVFNAREVMQNLGPSIVPPKP